MINEPELMATAIAQAINTVVTPLAARIASLERHLASRPGLKYVGTWTPTESFSPGDCVTYQGSLWTCRTKNTGVRPGDGAMWTLAAKRGRDGKDGKDAV
jgi:hypothetical protein